MSRLWQPGRRHQIVRPSGQKKYPKSASRRPARPRLEALEERTLLSLDLSGAFLLPVEPDAIGLIGELVPQEVDPVLTPVTAPLPLTLVSSGSVTEGGTAHVAFVVAEGTPEEILAGLTFSYDFNNDGVFEIEQTELASIEVPAEFLPDGPATVEVLARVTDTEGGSTDYVTTLEVQNVVPVLEVEAQEEVSDDGAVTLDLGAVDPGTDEVQTWIIDWGDGTQEVVPGDTPAVTHNFPEATAAFTVQVRAADDDGSYQAPPIPVAIAPPPVVPVPGILVSSVREVTSVPVAGVSNLTVATLSPPPLLVSAVPALASESVTLSDSAPLTTTETRPALPVVSTVPVSSGTNGAAVITGRVFHDANRNGLLDRGEAGVQGRTVVLEVQRNGTWQVVRQTRTDADGTYGFDGLALGLYRVRPDLGADHELTGVREGQVAPVNRVGEVAQVNLGVTRKAAAPQPEARLPLRHLDVVDGVFENWQAEGLCTAAAADLFARPLLFGDPAVFAEGFTGPLWESAAPLEPAAPVSDTLSGAVGVLAGVGLVLQGAKPAAEPCPVADAAPPPVASEPVTQPQRGWFGRWWDRLLGRG